MSTAVKVCTECGGRYVGESCAHCAIVAHGDGETDVAVLESLVIAMFAAEAVDMEHRQFIYRAGPQDWDAVPMSDAQHATLLRVYFGADV